MSKIKRKIFNASDWPCFGKHSRRDVDCSNCDIETSCFEQKEHLAWRAASRKMGKKQ